jgi:glycosyltransferase involved in cell wall biosynthesis
MRIAFAHMFTLRTPRGIERFIIQVSNTLVRMGHDVTIITGRCQDSPTRAWIDKRVRIHEIGHYHWHKISFIPGFMHDFLTNEYDVVNLFIARAEGYAAGLAHKLKKFRFNIIFSYPFENHEKHFFAFKRFAVSRHSDRLISPSNYIARGVERCFGRSSQMVPNGVDPSLFKIEPQRRNDARKKLGIPAAAPVLITVSALQGRKGIDKVLEVVGHLKQSMPDIRYILCGDGNTSDRESFHAKVDALGIASNVLFMGNQQDVAGYYNAADLFVFLPKFEGFGIVALEAMASGLPLVVSKGSAFPEILAEGGGIMVDPEAPAAIASTVHALLQDREQRALMRAEGLAVIEKRYTWDAVTLQLEKIFVDQIR